MCAGGFDGGSYISNFMGGQIVYDHDIARR
jgi:hypothetical protein